MAEYIPPKYDEVRKQVELYEGSGGTKGTTLMDTGLPCIIVTHLGNKTGAIRKIPLMRVKVENGYVLVGSMLGAPKTPFGCTTSEPILRWRYATGPKCTRCACGKSPMIRNVGVCGQPA
jgi:F420H(2)-dependent quinone reductase